MTKEREVLSTSFKNPKHIPKWNIFDIAVLIITQVSQIKGSYSCVCAMQSFI